VAHIKQESTARNAVHPSAKSGVLSNLLSRRKSHSLARESGLTVCSMMFFAIVRCYPLASLFSATQDDATHFPEVVVPGQSVTIPGKFEPTKNKTATVRIYLLAATRTDPLICACCRVEESDDRIDAGAAWQRYYQGDCQQRVLGYCNRQGRLASL